jgi:phospholipid transport system substrate-binding protein
MRLLQPRWLATIAATFSIFAASAAAADAGAEAFVTERANEILEILGDDSMAMDAKKAEFRTIVEEVADVPAIARFVLGRYSREATESDLADFTAVFRDYATGFYEARLDDYGGQTVTVTGSTDRQPGDTVVHTVITGGEGEPLDVNWRVLTRESGLKVVDVEVLGVWLAINERDAVTSIINNNRGSVAAATAALRQKIAQGDYGEEEG